MSAAASNSRSFTLVLHTHMPWVLHHGRWPHGLDWLSEAVAESYLPLWRVFHRRAARGARVGVTVGLSPVLCEQLAHPDFATEFRAYVGQRREAALDDAARFAAEGRDQESALAHRWDRFYRETLEDFFGPHGTNLVARFRALEERGALEVITCAATHGYLPLLGTALSVDRQIACARRAHRRHFGRDPRGIWLPECAYRPAGPWRSPVDRRHREPWRPGLESALAAHGLRYCFVDRHLIAGGRPLGVYPADDDPTLHATTGDFRGEATGRAPHGAYALGHSGIACFGRDARTAEQVWSRDLGYPGDPDYLEFHQRRSPGGHRYWAVTSARADSGPKNLYRPVPAARRAAEHAGHFLSVIRNVLREAEAGGEPAHLCAMYDTELFGHWWREGPAFLGEAIDAAFANDLELEPAGTYLDRAGPREPLTLPEGSWGAGGLHRVWLNPRTENGWRAVHRCERRFEHVAARALAAPFDPLLDRLLRQAAREVLLLESSDWPFLVTNASARDYAEARIRGHAADAHRLLAAAAAHLDGVAVSDRDVDELVRIERRDSLFADLDWAHGLRAPDVPGAIVARASEPKTRDRSDVSVERPRRAPGLAPATRRGGPASTTPAAARDPGADPPAPSAGPAREWARLRRVQ